LKGICKSLLLEAKEEKLKNTLVRKSQEDEKMLLLPPCIIKGSRIETS
jgi:hypothetical protein